LHYSQNYRNYNTSNNFFSATVIQLPSEFSSIDGFSAATDCSTSSSKVRVKVKVKINVKNDRQSASLSWNKTPIWGLRQIFISVRQLQVYW
jgi:hypothetical protein